MVKISLDLMDGVMLNCMRYCYIKAFLSENFIFTFRITGYISLIQNHLDSAAPHALSKNWLLLFITKLQRWTFCHLLDVRSMFETLIWNNQIYWPRLLQGMFPPPEAAFTPGYELCAGHQSFSRLDQTKSKIKQQLRRDVVKVQTRDGDVYYMDVAFSDGKMWAKPRIFFSAAHFIPVTYY